MKKCNKYINCFANNNLIGVRGPRGKTGPTGPSGKNGDTIYVRSTVTAEAGNSAKVIDTNEGNNHILDFVIPKGFIGPTGPTGPAGPVNVAFAHRFNDVGTIMNLTENVPNFVTLNRNGEAMNIGIEEEGSFIIKSNGIYKIDFFFSGWASIDTSLVLGIDKNDEIVDGSEISRDITANTDSFFYGSVIIKCVSNDSIGFFIKSRKDVTITYSPDINAYMIITKLF